MSAYPLGISVNQPEPRKVSIARIESDGMPNHTRVYLSDGSELVGITDVSWRQGVDDLASATFDALGPIALRALGVQQ